MSATSSARRTGGAETCRLDRAQSLLLVVDIQERLAPHILHGGGSPEAMKLEIFRNYPIGNKVDLVERLLDRGVLADATRKITHNRQPGRCCAAGCFAPDAPQMVALPRSPAKPPSATAPDPKPVAAD